MPSIDIIAGARPNFMKIAPIIRAMKQFEAGGGQLTYRLIHTGQHYDQRMSESFFQQLGIPDPDINLEVGSGTQAEQTAKIMLRYGKLPRIAGSISGASAHCQTIRAFAWDLEESALCGTASLQGI